MIKVLFISNIPSPYRVDFFNELGKYVDLTVIFEARRAKGIRFDWNDHYLNFKATFLSGGGYIQENKFNFSILKEIKRGYYDFIFATNYSYRTELLAYLKMILCRIPFVLEIDGGIIKRESFFLYQFKKFLLTKPYAYFSPSKNSDRYLMNYGVDVNDIRRYEFSSLRKQDIFHAPITDSTKTRLRKELHLSDKVTILCVAQIIPRKGIDVLVSALNQIERDYQCFIIGENPDKDYYHKILNNINDKTKILPFKNKNDLNKYYKTADFFVLPTRFDVWGLVINEALAKGLPVITTTECVAGAELIKNEKNGYLVAADDVKALRRKMEELMERDDQRRAMQKYALHSISSYTIENMVNSHRKFLGV